MKRSILNKKCILISAACCALLFANSLNASEQNRGKFGDIKSWESDEYKADWGLVRMNTAIAYALGATGKGVTLGVMDSGALLSHKEFSDGRVSALKISGSYYKDGQRYPDTEYGNSPLLKKGSDEKNRKDFGDFKKGEKFEADGNWIAGVNDSHGTHVAGTIAASRDGVGMHGVAFDAKLIMGNTGGTDGMTYGPNQDYNFFLASYEGLAKGGARAINNSWGSNRKFYKAYEGATGFDGGNSLDIKDLDAAYKSYYPFVTNGKNFIDAAYEVAKKYGIIQVFTAGNRNGMKESYTRAMLPYFRPDAEKYWINVTGQLEGDTQRYNTAGHSKWWSIAAPAKPIYSTIVDLKTGEAGYGKKGGTSMAAPHVTGALGLVMQRYPYMSNSQAREVLLTTARQVHDEFKKNDTRKISGFTAPLGVPDERWGWGALDMLKAMFGPGQLLGVFDVSLDTDDLYSNNISDVAIKYRKTEDEAEAQIWANRKAELEQMANLTAEQKAELDIGNAREKAREQRASEGYEGTLIKRGLGTLKLAGTNSYTGNTIIKSGKITALNQSLKSSEVVVENGGALEIVKEMSVREIDRNRFSQKLSFKDVTRKSTNDAVKATIKTGGSYIISNNAANLNLNFEKNSIIDISEPDVDVMKRLYDDSSKAKTYAVTGNFSGYNDTISKKYAFFDLTRNYSDNKLELTLKKSKNTITSIAASDNQKRVAQLIENTASKPALLTSPFRSRPAVITSDLYRHFIYATPKQASDTLKTFANNANLAQHNAFLLENILLKNAIINHEFDPFGAKAIDASGMNFWSNTMANAMKFDDVKANSLTQLFGFDGNVNDVFTLGGVLGASSEKVKEDGDDTYKTKGTSIGIYGKSQIASTKLDLGLIYTNAKRKTQNGATIVSFYSDEHVKSKEKALTAYANLALTAFNSANFSLNPYVGVSYLRMKTDSTSQNVGIFRMDVDEKTRNLGVFSIGLNPSVPFSLGSTKMKFEADLAYNRLVGNTRPNIGVNIANAGYLELEGKEVRDLGTASLGVKANVYKNVNLGLSYTGAFAKDVKSNSVNAKFEILF
ncbi:S8 family serine peptidase [Campylobacter concisus]|uniref:S8 family serine peptidase n=1 Tax=Campylobacter concisus TaxID=199 RepID=UPI0011E7BF44|nr:S8 family serine peptidase [Campylobacter concisus]